MKLQFPKLNISSLLNCCMLKQKKVQLTYIHTYTHRTHTRVFGVPHGSVIITLVPSYIELHGDLDASGTISRTK